MGLPACSGGGGSGGATGKPIARAGAPELAAACGVPPAGADEPGVLAPGAAVAGGTLVAGAPVAGGAGAAGEALDVLGEGPAGGAGCWASAKLATSRPARTLETVRPRPRKTACL